MKLRRKTKPDAIRVIVLKDPKNEERMITPTETSDGNTLFIMRQATDHIAGWHFTAPEGSIRHDQNNKPYIEVYPGGHEAIVITGQQVVAPRFGKDQSKEFITIGSIIMRFKAMAGVIGSLKLLIVAAIIAAIIACAVGGYAVYQGNNTQELVKQAIGMVGNLTRTSPIGGGGVIG